MPNEMIAAETNCEILKSPIYRLSVLIPSITNLAAPYNIIYIANVSPSFLLIFSLKKKCKNIKIKTLHIDSYKKVG